MATANDTASDKMLTELGPKRAAARAALAKATAEEHAYLRLVDSNFAGLSGERVTGEDYWRARVELPLVGRRRAELEAEVAALDREHDALSEAVRRQKEDRFDADLRPVLQEAVAALRIAMGKMARVRDLQNAHAAETRRPINDFGHPGLGAFGVGRELRALSTMLNPGEYLLDILQGQYANQTGVLLRTTTRLLFFGKGIVSTKVEEFPLEKVTSVQYSTGLMLGEVTIFASGNKAEIKATVKAHTNG